MRAQYKGWDVTIVSGSPLGEEREPKYMGWALKGERRLSPEDEKGLSQQFGSRNETAKAIASMIDEVEGDSTAG